MADITARCKSLGLPGEEIMVYSDKINKKQTQNKPQQKQRFLSARISTTLVFGFMIVGISILCRKLNFFH